MTLAMAETWEPEARRQCGSCPARDRLQEVQVDACTVEMTPALHPLPFALCLFAVAPKAKSHKPEAAPRLVKRACPDENLKRASTPVSPGFVCETPRIPTVWAWVGWVGWLACECVLTSLHLVLFCSSPSDHPARLDNTHSHTP